MIRRWKAEDMETVMDLWLRGNTEAHSFISPEYWQQNYKEVQRVIPIACTYVYEHRREVKGFISALDGFLLGIFVDADIRSRGMGMVLLDCMKQQEDSIIVTVYEKNVEAIHFFMRQKFKVDSELTEDSTGEKQLMMIWQQGDV